MPISGGPLPQASTANAIEGSIVANAYVERKVTVYAIHEPEADSLSLLTGLSTLFFSLGCLAASLPIGVWLNQLFSSASNPEAQKAIDLIFDIGVAVSLAFLILAGLTTYKQTTTWKKIKTQSKPRA